MKGRREGKKEPQISGLAIGPLMTTITTDYTRQTRYESLNDPGCLHGCPKRRGKG